MASRSTITWASRPGSWLSEASSTTTATTAWLALALPLLIWVPRLSSSPRSPLTPVSTSTLPYGFFVAKKVTLLFFCLPGFVEQTPSNQNAYQVLDDYVDPLSYPVFRFNSIQKDVGLVVYPYKAADDNRPKNYRLRSVWLQPNTNTSTVQVNPAFDISELWDDNSSDTAPALVWLPKTDGEFVLVWNRLTNASFINTAPVKVDGSMDVDVSDVVRNVRQSKLVWAYFRPGRGWTYKGDVTSSSSGLLATGAVFTDTAYVLFFGVFFWCSRI